MSSFDKSRKEVVPQNFHHEKISEMGQKHLVEVSYIEAGIVSSSITCRQIAAFLARTASEIRYRKCRSVETEKLLDLHILDFQSGIGDDLVEDALGSRMLPSPPRRSKADPYR